MVTQDTHRHDLLGYHNFRGSRTGCQQQARENLCKPQCMIFKVGCLKYSFREGDIYFIPQPCLGLKTHSIKRLLMEPISPIRGPTWWFELFFMSMDVQNPPLASKPWVSSPDHVKGHIVLKISFGKTRIPMESLK